MVNSNAKAKEFRQAFIATLKTLSPEGQQILAEEIHKIRTQKAQGSKNGGAA